MKERFDCDMTPEQYRQMRNLIRHQNHPKHREKVAGRARMFYRQPDGHQWWEVLWEGKWVPVIYDPHTETIVTALPEDARQYDVARAMNSEYARLRKLSGSP